jgi:pimeloyl-ACP methyl ester carboxylesterase
MPAIQINDIDMYYDRSGEGEPLLFLHGLGSSSRDWEFQKSYFSSRYQVISVDIRGHGRSEKPPGPYTIDLFARDVVELHKTLGLGPVHVVGLSMGGMIAFQLAVDQPSVVHTLTIVNSGPALIVNTLRLRLSFKKRECIVRLFGMRKMGKVLANALLPDAHQQELHRTFIDRWAENNRKAYLSSLRALIGWSVADRIHNIHCPTLIVTADQDYTPVAYKQAYADKIPSAAVAVIRHSRHMSPIDQPEAFNRTLDDFLDRYPVRGQP